MIPPVKCLFPLLLLSILRSTQGTERPIIGVVSQEVDDEYPAYVSYIAASYVKAVEQSGARVVPIFINQTDEYYTTMLNSLNGAVFPGGDADFLNKGGYADVGRIIMNYAKEASKRGDHFPVLGVCLGFELLFFLEIESYDVLITCNATNVPLPLTFKADARQSKLFRRVSPDIFNILRKLPVTYNYHRHCVTEELLKKFHLDEKWKVLSTNVDFNGTEFISTVESNKYPFVGIQFHPEKNAYEWKPSLNIAHSQKGLLSSRYFYDWLVKEARKSNHAFNSSTSENKALIYNYNPTFTGAKGGYFTQTYLFK